jgi:hypothetical protein
MLSKKIIQTSGSRSARGPAVCKQSYSSYDIVGENMDFRRAPLITSRGKAEKSIVGFM